MMRGFGSPLSMVVGGVGLSLAYGLLGAPFSGLSSTPDSTREALQPLNPKFTAFVEEIQPNSTLVWSYGSSQNPAAGLQNVNNSSVPSDQSHGYIDLSQTPPGYLALSVKTKQPLFETYTMYWTDHSGMAASQPKFAYQYGANSFPLWLPAQEPRPSLHRNQFTAGFEQLKPSTSSPFPCVDHFAFIPRPAAADGAWISRSGQELPATERELLELRHYPVQRRPEPSAHHSVTVTSHHQIQAQFDWGPRVDLSKPMVSQGVQVDLPHVCRAWVMNRQHQWHALTPQNTPHTLGQFHPHLVLFQRCDGAAYVLSTGALDMIQVGFATPIVRSKTKQSGIPSQQLSISLFTYHADERKTQVTQVSSELRYHRGQWVWYRQHPNLGVTQQRSASQLALSIQPLPKEAVEQLSERQLPFRKAGVPWLGFVSLQPKGTSATLIITDHADYHEAVTDRWLMYGNEQAQYRSGEGFLGNHIPLTKSIFVLGDAFPFEMALHPSEPLVKFNQASYQGDVQFRQQLMQYQRAGARIEYGPHTAGTRHYTAQETEQALKLIKPLKPQVWIDHGSTPTMMMRGGWDKQEPNHYLVPLLAQYGYKYVWMNGDRYPFVTLSKDFSLIRDNLPANLLYTLPRLNPSAQTPWPVKVFSTGGAYYWDADFFSDPVLNRFIDQRGVYIIHAYLGLSAFDYHQPSASQRRVTLYPWFNPLLQRLHRAEQSGSLNLSTLSQWARYVELAQNVQVQWVQTSHDPVLVVTNPNAEAIKGFTLAIKPLPSIKTGSSLALPKAVLYRGRLLPQKTIQHTTYVWWDLPPGQSILSLKPDSNKS